MADLEAGVFFDGVKSKIEIHGYYTCDSVKQALQVRQNLLK